MSGELLVAVEHTPAYRVLTANPQEGTRGRVVPLDELRRDPERYLGPLHCAASLGPAPEAYQRILDLVERTHGVPLGLTFDGGIAVTYTDYRLAERRWDER